MAKASRSALSEKSQKRLDSDRRYSISDCDDNDSCRLRQAVRYRLDDCYQCSQGPRICSNIRAKGKWAWYCHRYAYAIADGSNSFSSQRNAKDGLGVRLKRWKGCRPRVVGSFARLSLCLSNARTSVTSCALDRLHSINTRLWETGFDRRGLNQLMQEYDVLEKKGAVTRGHTVARL
jgi:hypothetical protein